MLLPTHKVHPMLQWLAQFLTAPIINGFLDAYKAKLAAANAQGAQAVEAARAALIAGTREEERRARAETLLKTVGLKQKGFKRPEELSGGEQQRVAVCLALVNNPSIILADEPTGNLDSATGDVILELLQRIARKGDTAVVMATHSNEAAGIADLVVRLRDGRIESVCRTSSSSPG